MRKFGLKLKSENTKQFCILSQDDIINFVQSKVSVDLEQGPLVLKWSKEWKMRREDF